jgi:23S rRNA (cytosine1962-C5)-methyltransferase
MSIERLYAENWPDYELLDAGGGKKLERFGKIITIRPELQAYFHTGWTFEKWEELAHLQFVEKTTTKGYWKKLKPVEDSWNIQFDELTVKLQLTNFKHLGIFPEQEVNWKYIRENLEADKSLLNLFAYTGISSLAAKTITDTRVTHVDSMKQLISWAKENMELSNLEDIRWIHDDALKFAQKEIKRGNTYDAIIMDPPAYGIGAKGEKWILDEKLPLLLSSAKDLLARNGFLLVNTYSPKLKGETLLQMAQKTFPGKTCEVLELWRATKTKKDLFYGLILRVHS